LNQLIAEGSKALGGGLTFSGNIFYRNLRTKSFNGDGTIFEECGIGDEEFLVEEDFEDLDEDGECSGADEYELVLDEDGEPIGAELDDEELNAINNIGRRRQKSHGTTLQLAHELELGNGRRNDLTLGAGWQRGKSAYDSVVEVAQLTEDRGTTRPGIFAAEY